MDKDFKVFSDLVCSGKMQLGHSGPSIIGFTDFLKDRPFKALSRIKRKKK